MTNIVHITESQMLRKTQHTDPTLSIRGVWSSPACIIATESKMLNPLSAKTMSPWI